MKLENLEKYATDEQEKQQLRLKKGKSGTRPSKEIVKPMTPKFEVTGGKDPVTLNKRKGKTY